MNRFQNKPFLTLVLTIIAASSFAMPAGHGMKWRPLPHTVKNNMLVESVVVIDNNTNVTFNSFAISGKDVNGVDFNYSYSISLAPGNSYTLPDAVYDGIAQIDNITVTANNLWEGGAELYDVDWNLLYSKTKGDDGYTFSFSVPGTFASSPELLRIQFWY